MRKLVLLCASLCAMAFVVPTTPAHAQIRYWVASYGADSNSCSETSPCATFAGAIVKGGAGEIDCLNSGDYGALNSTTVSITGSITIDCGTGNIGEMGLNGGTIAIDINTSSAATIILRHLNLNGFNTANTGGIATQNFLSGTLIIEHCQIHGFANGSGVEFAPSSGRGILEVSDSVIYNNGTGVSVSANGSGVIASVVFDGDKLNNNIFGLYLLGTGVVAGTLRQSVVAENSSNGVSAQASQVYFTVEESSIIDNLQVGIATYSSGAVVNVGASTIGGNGTGVSGSSGSIISFGNNQMSANGTNGNFTSTTALR
jgi:hypothetical protein